MDGHPTSSVKRLLAFVCLFITVVTLVPCWDEDCFDKPTPNEFSYNLNNLRYLKQKIKEQTLLVTKVTT